MGFEKKAESETKTTVKMQFTGTFKGTQKTVELPIPLVSNSQKLEQKLTFVRASDRSGPASCEVPMEWVGALMAVGGNWKVVEKLTPELTRAIQDAKEVCDAKMEKFALENELVEA